MYRKQYQNGWLFCCPCNCFVLSSPSAMWWSRVLGTLCRVIKQGIQVDKTLTLHDHTQHFAMTIPTPPMWFDYKHLLQIPVQLLFHCLPCHKLHLSMSNHQISVAIFVWEHTHFCCSIHISYVHLQKMQAAKSKLQPDIQHKMVTITGLVCFEKQTYAHCSFSGSSSEAVTSVTLITFCCQLLIHSAHHPGFSH